MSFTPDEQAYLADVDRWQATELSHWTSRIRASNLLTRK